MPFINDKLGNGFRIKEADSSKDQEHYFSGAKKHIRFSIRGLSGSSDVSFEDASIENNDVITLPATEFIELTGVLYDINDVKINTASFLEEVTGLKPEDFDKKTAAELTLRVSSSAGDVVIYPEMVQYRSASLESFVSIFSKGATLSSDVDSEGFRSIRWNFAGVPDPDITLTNQVKYVLLSSSAQVHTFKNVKFEFHQSLSDNGVLKYRTIDNQHNKRSFSLINGNILVKID